MGPKTEDIFAEIRRLLDEQSAALAKAMSHAEADEYIQRRQRIDELVQELARKRPSG